MTFTAKWKFDAVLAAIVAAWFIGGRALFRSIDLDVFLVCGECGTEYQVTRLGEIQVPRHCGEPMKVVRRPRQQPLAN